MHEVIDVDGLLGIHTGQVGAGAEVIARCAQHHSMDVVDVLGVVECPVKRYRDRATNCVAQPRPIEP
ncbi:MULTISPECIES: hypothetical protein [unclassified Mycobacterium]|uniref:hypothetical protein n=1 Tax=unclassified Mycobacterium TaxID=2642494 RepID=UPI00073FEF8D|nr:MULTISPECIES: hypothetical protein [unclassified Mycobacterium]KUH87734.1 hypothetical protein AU185_04635 [Mycobacterium sp. GA-0227b]KUH87781.1 hypothetical protein AU186_03620 [Mycobacterium sp. GA-1999]KUH88673.1 hypothetical protein AU187_06970 [Mycobacterium sp. IS-1556]